jgi:hypothetical protein
MERWWSTPQSLLRGSVEEAEEDAFVVFSEKGTVRLWSHYADGFRGMAIEVEIPDKDPHVPYSLLSVMSGNMSKR